MQTSDWAVEAYFFFIDYHRAILNNQDRLDELIKEFFPNEQLYKQISPNILDHHPLLKNINFLHNCQKSSSSSSSGVSSSDSSSLSISAFEALDQERGWNPLLRRLPKVDALNYRILTIIRRDLLTEMDVDASNSSGNNNQKLVSRQQWALIEIIRWKKGFYSRKDVLEVIKRGLAKMETKSRRNLSSATCASSSSDLCMDESLSIEQANEEEAGKCVRWRGKQQCSAGTLVLESRPFVVALYDYDGTSKLCFHCSKAIKASPVQNLTLLCPLCQIWSYCSMECKSMYKDFHEQECKFVPYVLDKCQQVDMPLFKGLLVYRAALKASLLHKQTKFMMDQSNDWKGILHLESHAKKHFQYSIDFSRQVTEVASWMLDQHSAKLCKKIIDLSTLTNLFFAINVNAISLTDNGGVGLFPGISSTFNHSCNENLTHAWNMQKGVMQFRTVERIKFGDECCFSYVSILDDATKRNENLTQYKFFKCQCPRCVSPDDEGRLASLLQWKHFFFQLQEEQDRINNSAGHQAEDQDKEEQMNERAIHNAISIYYQLIQLSDIIFPCYSISKGHVREEYAHALLQINTNENVAKAKDYLLQAKEHYLACRGIDSPYVQRVNEAILEIDSSSKKKQANPGKGAEDDLEDLKLSNDWCRTLFEFKLFQQENQESSFEKLSKLIRETFDKDHIQWVEEFRTYDIGFGIKTLVMSCMLNENVQLKEELCQEILQDFYDTFRSIDIINVQDYHY